MKKILFLFLIFISCKEENSKKITKITANTSERKCIITDTISDKYKTSVEKEFNYSRSRILYIGKEKDSIFIQRFFEQEEISFSDFRNPKVKDINIFVDTSQIIGEFFKFPEPPPPLSYKKEILKEDRLFYSYKSYPVVIKNLSKDTLYASFGEIIPIYIEAIDSSNQWKPIQNRFQYFCGVGVSRFYLPKNEIMVSNCKIFKGNFKTKMRMVFGYEEKIYSNEFSGKINYTQFDHKK